jgi:hypothetical protein
MKRLMIVTLLILPLLFFSCKKDNSEQSVPQSDFVKLETGNYWIFDFYKIDTNGVETKLDHTDSSFILKDTLINGNQYFVKVSDLIQFEKSSMMTMVSDTMFLRDSSGYLVTPTGFIMFARDNFTDVIHADTASTLTWWEYKMTGKDSIVTVPAGTFTTRTMGVTYYPLSPNYPWGIRKVYNVYGAGVGMVKYTYALYSQPDHYEARLLRYNVNN